MGSDRAQIDRRRETLRGGFSFVLIIYCATARLVLVPRKTSVNALSSGVPNVTVSL